MDFMLRPMMWLLPLAAVGWFYRGMKKKAKIDADQDDASFPLKNDHSKDKLR
jgi:hypothetical protein